MSEETPVIATKPSAYLVIAHYDHERWKALDLKERLGAESRAETMFPDEEPRSLEGLEGVRAIRTFYSAFHSKIAEYNFGDKPMEEMCPEERQERDAKVGEILADLPRKVPNTEINGPGTAIDDPGIGWVAVIDASSFASFVTNMGGAQSSLWRMYDIEVIPLNNDQTTLDIYKKMTPVHWG
ncbi:MAG: hypothetical protein ACJ8CR_12945 [Roseiflexaceae bacterium]